MPAGDLEIESAGKTARRERLIEVGERRFGAIGEFILDGVVGQSARHPRSQPLVGEQPVERGTLHKAQIAIVGLVTTALLAVGFRRSVPLLFLLGYMLKGAALFHPSYFYPDVRLHRRHLEAFEAASGGILERGVAAQKVAQTAYPRIIAGRAYAFPYSPVFYLPFTLLDRDARGIEAAMTCHVAIDLVLHGLGAVFRGPGPG